MAITVQNTDQRVIQLANTGLDSDVLGGQVWYGRWSHTQATAAGDDGSSIVLPKMPPNVRIILSQSTVLFAAYGAARTLDLGWLAYVDKSGTDIVADPNGLADGVDVSAAGHAFWWDAPTSAVESKLFDGSNVILSVTVVGGTIPQGTLTEGLLVGIRG